MASHKLNFIMEQNTMSSIKNMHLVLVGNGNVRQNEQYRLQHRKQDNST